MGRNREKETPKNKESDAKRETGVADGHGKTEKDKMRN